MNKITERSTTPPIQFPPVTSITDVFADVVMQKARKALGETAAISIKTKIETTKTTSDGTNEFDIPTISEIAKDAVTKSTQRKEITELQELQKKINEAKRQLRQMTDESEDEDFINIRDDNNDLDNDFRKDGNKEKAMTDASALNNVAPKTKLVQQTDKDEIDRRSIRDRLGTKAQNENIVSLSAHRRVEQAIYVPAFRRNAQENTEQRDRRTNETERVRVRGRSIDRERERIRERSKERNTKPVRDLREKVRISERLGAKSNRESDRISKVDVVQKRGLVSKRIGSRVIVASKRSKSDVENEIVVNSVVSVKPRPILPTNKQASKNLLLRAVAEAQKSTALVKPKPDPLIGPNRIELYTKSFKANKHLSKSNIIVEVETGETLNDSVIIGDGENDMIVEYVPSNEIEVDDDEYEYIPQPISSPEG